jgi:YgiT-type zinc finger domain-containing protein
MKQNQKKSPPRLPVGRQERGRCKYCRGNTRKDITKAALWSNRGLIVIEDIPARLCEGCGEQFFETEVMQRMQRVITPASSPLLAPRFRGDKFTPAKAGARKQGGAAAAKAKRQIRAPVYSLPQVRAAREAPLTAWKEKRHEGISNSKGEHSGETFLCAYCGSETVEDLVKSVFWVDGRLLIVENIPARVCQRCRQQFYDEETADNISALDKGKSLPGVTRRYESVPVFSLHRRRKSPTLASSVEPRRKPSSEKR